VHLFDQAIRFVHRVVISCSARSDDGRRDDGGINAVAP